MGVLLGINKVALRYQWAPYIHLGPCYDLGPLWLFLTRYLGCLDLRFAEPTHPPTTTLPSPLPPNQPLIHDIHDITETFQKTFTKPVILTSCQLVHIMLTITLVYTTGASLAWLQSSTREIQCHEYLKLVFLKIPNVRFETIFQSPVTYYVYIP